MLEEVGEDQEVEASRGGKALWPSRMVRAQMAGTSQPGDARLSLQRDWDAQHSCADFLDPRVP